MSQVLCIRGDRNAASKWKDLDPVVVKEDGAGWGKQEHLSAGRFYLIQLPGVSVADTLEALGNLQTVDEFEPSPAEPDPMNFERGAMVHRRVKRVKRTLLSAGLRNSLDRDGQVSVPGLNASNRLTAFNAVLETRTRVAEIG